MQSRWIGEASPHGSSALSLCPNRIVFPPSSRNIQKSPKKYWQTSILRYITKYSFLNIDLHRFWKDDFKSDNACGALRENTATSEAALNCRQTESVNDSFDFEFQSRLHECEAKHTKGKFYPFDKSVRICVPAFLLPEMPVTTEWPAEWDMILRWYERNNAAWDGGRNCIQAERQKHPRERHRRCRIP